MISIGKVKANLAKHNTKGKKKNLSDTLEQNLVSQQLSNEGLTSNMSNFVLKALFKFAYEV